MNSRAFKLDWLTTMRNENVFIGLQLDNFTPPVLEQPSSEPHPVIVHYLDDWEVERIFHYIQHCRKQQQLDLWDRYRIICTNWEPFEIIPNATQMLDKFHHDYQNRVRKAWMFDIGHQDFLRKRDMAVLFDGSYQCFDQFSVGTPSSTNGPGTGLATCRNPDKCRGSLAICRTVNLDSTDHSWDSSDCSSMYAGYFCPSICT